MKNRMMKRLASALLSVLVLTAAVAPCGAFTVTQDEIDELITQANGLERQRSALEDEISGYSDDIAATMEQKAVLDEQIAQIEAEVAELEAEIRDCEEDIATKEAELADAKRREAEKYEQFCQRVRAMEEQGRLNCWMILFHATSFVDFLTRLDFVSEIMQADQRVIDDLKALQEQIARTQAELEAERLELEAANAACLEKKGELDVQREAANQLIIELEARRSEAESSMDALSEEAEAIQAEVVRLSKELARQEAEARERAEREARERAEREAAEARERAARERQAAEARERAERQTREATETREDAAWKETDSYRALREQVSEKLDGFSFTPVFGGYIWPVNSRRITSTFGGRSSPGGIGSTNHKGVDIGSVGYNTVVHAAKSGVVIISQYSSSYGNYVVVSHGSGNTTLYAHMSSRLVSVGESVAQGDALGITGSTGHSTGPHLHFEITENGVRVNPLLYLSGYSLA